MRRAASTPVFLALLCALFFASARADVPPPPVQKPPLRLVSLKPNITALLVELGLGGDIMGVTKFCPKPNAQAVVVADYVSLDTEAVVRLKPDLVLSSPENSQSRQYDALKNAGIAVAFLRFDSVADLFLAIDALGRRLGAEDRAKALSDSLREKLEQIRRIAAPFKGKRFAVMVQREPLMTASGGTFISSLLTAAGLENVFGKNRIPYPVLDAETLLAKNPDFIFDMTHDAETGRVYFARDVIRIDIGDFLAAPGSFAALEKLVETLARE